MYKRYKITIEEEVEESQYQKREYVKGDDGEYFWSDQVPAIRVVKRDIYTRDLDDLDIKETIKAIEGL